MIIGIAGEAGSGKGTAAEVLIGKGYTRGKFANALKDMLRALLRYRGLSPIEVERCIEGDLKELPHPALNGKSPRHAMQTLGAWGRNDIEEDFWVDTELEAQAGAKNLLFDDLRHDNEEAAIVAAGGLVLQIIGRGGIPGNHFSESFQPAEGIATVIDNSGTIEEFREKVDRFAVDVSWVN